MATEPIDARDSGLCPEISSENRIANNVASAMEKLRLQCTAKLTDLRPEESKKVVSSADR
jgi:hypothetical protein